MLEALVVPDFMFTHISERLDSLKETVKRDSIPVWKKGDAVDSDEAIVIVHNWDEIRQFMWDYVGILRTRKSGGRAKTLILNIRKEIDKYYWDFLITPDLIELRNIASVAEIIIDSALSRKESRALHYNADYPDQFSQLDNIETIIKREL